MATVDLGKIKFVWKGAYAAGTAYTVDDVVESAGSSYVCILASTGNAPPNATYWELMADKGVDTSVATTQGDVLYHNGTSLARLAAGTSGNFLQTQGSGANPQWASASAGLKSQQVFTSSGTWTKPSGINLIKVCVTGGGGGGGSGNSTHNARGGGGGGGTAIEVIDVSSVSSVTVTVGSGGAGGAAGENNGSTGGTSSFGSYCSATGGYGGRTQPSASTAGVGSGGDINISGGDGTQYEGGGSSADEGGSTTGGASYWGGGGQGAGGNGNDVRNGQAYGSGGGGGQHNGSSGTAGGAGAAGVVVVEEYA